MTGFQQSDRERAREALARAFDGVISNTPGPDYWAADHVLEVLASLPAVPQEGEEICPDCDGTGYEPQGSSEPEDSSFGAQCVRCGGGGTADYHCDEDGLRKAAEALILRVGEGAKDHELIVASQDVAALRAALASAGEPAPREITDEMVERASVAFYREPIGMQSDACGRVRAALEAALGAQEDETP